MNWKRNPTIVASLSVALGICLVVIVYLLFTRNSSKTEYVQLPHAQQQPTPPQQQPMPRRVPPQTAPPQGGGPALVLFHSEWCGHCKALMPAWKKVEQALQGSGIEVLTLDDKALGSDMQKHGIVGFPDVRLYPGGFPSSEPIKYKGDRSFESLMKFVSSRGMET